MTHDYRSALDWATWLSAGVAAVSLAQAALVVTFLAGCLSVVLGLVRLHDRWRYGPGKRGE